MKRFLFPALLLSLLLLLPAVSAEESEGFLAFRQDIYEAETYSSTKLSVKVTDSTQKTEAISFTWCVQNESVAYIRGDSAGMGVSSVTLKTLKDGVTTITCEAVLEDGTTDSVSCCLKVGRGESGHLTSISISDSALFCRVGDSKLLFVTVDDEDKCDSAAVLYHWYSKEPGIADVDSEGGYGKDSVNVIAKGAGTTTICCEASLGGSLKKYAACTFTVNGSSEGSLSRFGLNQIWRDPFPDVSEGDWFYPYVKRAYQYGLMDGKENGEFAPNDSFTAAEAIKVAACIHSKYHTGSLVPAIEVSPWYTPYVNYCMANRLLYPGDFADYNAPCTRSQMAGLFAACLPAEELAPLRSVTIPDCSEDTPRMKEIQLLYDAGVLSGDKNHAFRPDDSIRRSEVAKILCTLLSSARRDRTEF